MDVQSDKIFVSYSSMNDNFQGRMLFKHPFNELNKVLRPVFGHLRIMLRVRKSDVLTSRFGWLFLVYSEFVECGDELLVFLFHGLRCHSQIPSNCFHPLTVGTQIHVQHSCRDAQLRHPPARFAFQGFHSAKLEADTRSIKSGHSNPWTCLRAASLIRGSATGWGSFCTRANRAWTKTFLKLSRGSSPIVC